MECDGCRKSSSNDHAAVEQQQHATLLVARQDLKLNGCELQTTKFIKRTSGMVETFTGKTAHKAQCLANHGQGNAHAHLLTKCIERSSRR
eukprot:4400320-Amphidinium_carterae.2